jgi:hypothetical protein
MQDRQRGEFSLSGAAVGGSVFLLGRVIQSGQGSVSSDWLILGYGKAEYGNEWSRPVVEGGFRS